MRWARARPRSSRSASSRSCVEPTLEPSNIVAFTFTEKAAAELKERVTNLVTETFGNVIGLAELFIGTMHGYALDALQTHVAETFKYSVLDDIQTRLLIDRHSRESGLTATDAIVNGQARKLRRYVNSRLYMQVTNILREDDVDASLVPAELAGTLDAYRGLLHRLRYFDYTELLRMVVDLLAEDPDDSHGRARWSGTSAITCGTSWSMSTRTPTQSRKQLIEKLCRFGANLCVVGDDDQTIYQWRGSAVSNILTFVERRQGVKRVTLDDNFRSSRGIVALGQAIAEQNAGERLDKNMVAAGHQRFDRGDMLALTFDDAEQEARWICDRIGRLRGMPFLDEADGQARGLVLVGFRGPVPQRQQGRRAAGGRDEAPRDPVRDQGPDPALRRTRSPGVRPVLPVRHAPGHGRRPDRRVARCRPRADPRRPHPTALPSWKKRAIWKPGERWGTYNIQRTYLRFLEELKIREETIPSADGTTRGELVFYNLGKFSQAISDFEQIYFQSEPQRKYEGFANWLVYQAPEYYAESDADVGYATPDAVTHRHRPPGQGHAVAERVRPRAAQEPLPVPPAGRP